MSIFYIFCSFTIFSAPENFSHTVRFLSYDPHIYQKTSCNLRRNNFFLWSLHPISCAVCIRPCTENTICTLRTPDRFSGIPSQTGRRSVIPTCPLSYPNCNCPAGIHPEHRNRTGTRFHPPRPHTAHCICPAARRLPVRIPSESRYNSS